MKKIGPELDRIINEKGIVKKNIAQQLKITPTYFSRLLKADSMDCQMLENICKIIGISPSIFFEGQSINIGGANATSVLGTATAQVNITQGEAQALRQLLQEKERTIQILLQKSGQ